VLASSCSRQCQRRASLKLLHRCLPTVNSGPEDIVSLVREQLPGNARLAVFDAVTSNTALVLPLPALVQLCRDRCVHGC
jgi:hypothetical protein